MSRCGRGMVERLHCSLGQAVRGKESLVLGIESSCDDTGVALVSTAGRVVAQTVVGQSEIHSAWGGVVPKLAQEAHKKVIDGCVDAILREGGVHPSELGGIAVTVGPGLSLCLRVGVEKAVGLHKEHGVPLLPVHHMEAHALVARMTEEGEEEEEVQFPFLCLLVSGGHNLLVVVEGVGRYVQLGTTLDDALGTYHRVKYRILEYCGEIFTSCYS